MTCQFMCNVVYNVGIVQPPSLVLPPALDVDTRLPLKIRQVEVVSDDTNNTFHQNGQFKKQLLGISFSVSAEYLHEYLSEVQWFVVTFLL